MPSVLHCHFCKDLYKPADKTSARVACKKISNARVIHFNRRFVERTTSRIAPPGSAVQLFPRRTTAGGHWILTPAGDGVLIAAVFRRRASGECLVPVSCGGGLVARATVSPGWVIYLYDSRREKAGEYVVCCPRLSRPNLVTLPVVLRVCLISCLCVVCRSIENSIFPTHLRALLLCGAPQKFTSSSYRLGCNQALLSRLSSCKTGTVSSTYRGGRCVRSPSF